MRVQLISPMGNTSTVYGEKDNVIVEVKMLTSKLGYRILDDKNDVVQFDVWEKLIGDRIGEKKN